MSRKSIAIAISVIALILNADGVNTEDNLPKVLDSMRSTFPDSTFQLHSIVYQSKTNSIRSIFRNKAARGYVNAHQVADFCHLLRDPSGRDVVTNSLKTLHLVLLAGHGGQTSGDGDDGSSAIDMCLRPQLQKSIYGQTAFLISSRLRDRLVTNEDELLPGINTGMFVYDNNASIREVYQKPSEELEGTQPKQEDRTGYIYDLVQNIKSLHF